MMTTTVDKLLQLWTFWTTVELFTLYACYIYVIGK